MIRRWPFVLVAIIALPYVGCEIISRNHHLSFVPCGMDVAGIESVTEQASGFGPGGNEAGIIVYNLAETTIQGIEAEGIEYLRGLSCSRDTRDWHGRYSNWRETPILADHKWGETGALRVANYLNQYGFGISGLSPDEGSIDGAISGPGSFYSYGRIGLILIVPRSRQAFYIYAG